MQCTHGSGTRRRDSGHVLGGVRSGAPTPRRSPLSLSARALSVTPLQVNNGRPTRTSWRSCWWPWPWRQPARRAEGAAPGGRPRVQGGRGFPAGHLRAGRQLLPSARAGLAAHQGLRSRQDVDGQADDLRHRHVAGEHGEAGSVQGDHAEAVARRGRRPASEARALAAEGRAVVYIDGGLHANECAPAQHLIQLAYDLVAGDDADTRLVRDNVITILVFANPDGMNLLAEWYQSNLGTPYEVGPMPWLYHKYSGHDNNRDSYMTNLVETRNITRLVNQEWYPRDSLQPAPDRPVPDADLRAAAVRADQPEHPPADPAVAEPGWDRDGRRVRAGEQARRRLRASATTAGIPGTRPRPSTATTSSRS